MSTTGNQTDELTFTSAAEYSTLKDVLSEFAGSGEYAALAQSHEVASNTAAVVEKLLPVKLFQERLETLLDRKSTPLPVGIHGIRTRLNRYVARLAATVDMLNGVARPVPNIMHFVWVGGSEVGANQRDYMNIWRQVLEPQGYRFNLWYDSDALLAFEMNRVILDSARTDAMATGGDQVTSPDQLSQMIEDRARALKHQMFDFLNQPQWAGRADEARIELMVRAYGKDHATLEAFRQRCLETHQAMAGTDLQLRDVRHEFAGHFLQDVYQREVSLRGNFAAASDVVRLQAEYLEGGRYSDMDYLPPLAKTLGGVDISGFDDKQRLWLLKLLLDHDQALMPGRDRNRYTAITGKVPARHEEALTTFARGKPGIHQIFVAPQDNLVPHDALRLGTAEGRADRGEMNAHFIAHPGSAMTLAYMQMIRVNYDCLLEAERRLLAAGIDIADQARALPVIQNVVNEAASAGKFPKSSIYYASGKLTEAICTYYRDGIRVNAVGTITLTGPGAGAAGHVRYIEQRVPADQIDKVRDRLKLLEGYNVYTEEERISGWTVGGDENKWLENEQEKWRSGKLKSRYVGQLADLLRPQTLTFKQGWPVIEGKPVLLTSVLQQLMDDLGEPFIRAMKDKLSGDITFTEAFSIGFDTRQQILAQPAFELPPSLGAESTSNLNELLVRVARGSLVVEQLSPLLRVMLGGMFGAASLDIDGFAGAWKKLSNLAARTADDGLFARYNAIENALRQSASPAFKAGLASAEPSTTYTARELKVRALSDPLTVRQWGERIARINSTARREYHGQILRSGEAVRTELFDAGAISARKVPQDLLMTTPGDPGRRCYPLALMMAAALVGGEAAERALIGRVANVSHAAEDADSRALLAALDELQTVPLTAVGKLQGHQSLDTIVQALEAKSASTVMLLDTGNHALLMAKIVAGSQTVYRFYEPNFAIYGFARVEQLKEGMQRYLSRDEGAMARLYGLAEGDRARFNVVELDTTVIADKTLLTNTRLDSFLHNAPIVDPRGASVWEKQAVARQRSLSENARMGASLAQQDARYWAQTFEQATGQLRAENKLGAEYLPLLETLQKNPDAGYSVTLVDARDPQNARVVTTTDARFGKIQQHIQRLVKTLAGKPATAGEADGGSRLSFAFAIQTLITEMRHREYQAGAEQVPALSIALQVQVYVSYAQLGYGVLNDAVQIVSLVRQVAASEQALALRQSSLAGRLLGRASVAAGIVFSVVNIGFDLYGLAVATNQEQRSRLATQLVFNVAALALDITALAVGGAVGGAAAILSVPLLGVGIGVAAIASNLGQISDKAKGVGAHLRKIQDAYGPGVYTRKDGALSFEPEAVITELDLQNNRIRFDSQKFYPMDRGGLELPQFNNHPTRLHQAIDIRQTLGLPQVVSLIRPAPGDVQTVVLPCTPQCYFGYEYQVGTSGYAYEPQPGELEREPRQASEKASSGLLNAFLPFGGLADELSEPFMQTWYPSLRNRTVNKLEYDEHGNQRFYFFANTPIPHILYKLYPFNKPTRIVVTLDEQVRQLLVPTLPAEWKGCISYEIFTRSPGARQLWLTPGLVAVSLRNYAATQWVLHAPWVSENRVRFAESFLSVDGIRIEGQVDFIQLNNGEMFNLDWKEQRLLLVSVTQEQQDSQAALLARIGKRVAERRVSAAYVPLYKFRVPMSFAPRSLLVTAFYDVAHARLLYARNLPENVSDGVALAAANAGQAWFYHPEHATVWRVDAITGTVNHRYRLMNPASGARIIGCEQTADGLRVRQKMLEVNGGVETTFEYQLSEYSVVLTGIHTSAAWSDYTPRRTAAYWRSLVDRFKTPRAYADGTSGMASSLSAWGCAGFVQIRSHEQQTLRDLGWIRLADQLYFQLAHSTGLKLDTVLLSWNDGLGDQPLFYSIQARLLRRGAESADGQVIAEDVIDVSSFAERYIATRKDGRLFEVDKRGELQFVGVGLHWLRSNTDWLAALPALADAHRDAPFAIIGLSNVSGLHSVAAWCIGAKVLLADVGEGKELALLGLTPDNQAAWLLDVSAGQLYRQTLVQIQALRAAFANGQRLLDRTLLPMAEKVWGQWSFAEVVTQGQGLLGRTRQGVNLELLDQQPARIVGVEKQWSFIAGQTAEQLQARLKALLSGQAHAAVLQVEDSMGRYKYFVPELDRLFDVSGRADGQWSEFLGARNTSVAMLFDPIDSLIYSRGAVNGIWVKDSYARREGEILALDVSGEVTDLMAMLPDGVEKLILTFGAKALSYRISEQAWQRLDCIVVDRQVPQGAADMRVCTLVLDMVAAEHLLVSLVDGQLVFSDPDTAHSLIVRNVTPGNDESGRPMQINVRLGGVDYQRGVEEWLDALSQVHPDQEVATLERLIKQLS
ncbi:insecticidal toxin [Pseudomonas sp. EB276 TE3739]|uniref:TcdA/TcdB pore-forming domain-containing protein n=1 Tax=Pseudomonas TaxID=286 RepID=UPI00209DE7D4|nr:TcdA/TcdB pore-forming domain-containing protein [Pseudomonas koreensis]MCP1474229.1 insecticidal toxin [Pseudomonas koreensis]